MDLSGTRLDKERVSEIISAGDLQTVDTLKRSDFYYREVYKDKTDETITTIWLDSLRNIVGVNQKKKNGVFIFVGEYYSNGQIRGTVPLNSEGNVTGPVVYYYEDGKVSRSGYLKNGIKVGEWKNFDESGKLIDKGKGQ